MGFEPLPFDPIGPCLCHRRCPTFDKVAARYWVKTITFGDQPRLDAGVLMEIDPGSAGQAQCIWTPVIPFTFPDRYLYVMVHLAEPSPFPIIWRAEFDVLLTPLAYIGIETDPIPPCSAESLLLTKIAGPALWESSLSFRVEWWQNANDVPH